MTRVNCVPPSELHSKHLVAEYREIARVPKLAYAAFQRGEEPDDPRNPTSYVLGTGHVRFFYNKLRYLDARFNQLVREMEKRGFKPQFRQLPLAGYMPHTWFRGWAPDEDALAINRQRLKERMPKS